MKRLALGWACNLNNLLVRFPYEKFPGLKRYPDKKLKRQIVKQVFREGLDLMIDDIIENNVSIKFQGIGYQGGELHMEPVKGEEFKRVYALGKFKGVDFLESLFTGYQLYLYIKGKRDNFLCRRKFPVYIKKYFKDKLTQYTNEGRTYC